MSNEEDLLNKFIENERKSKQTTLILVIVFIAIAIAIILMAFQISKKTKENQNLNSKNEILTLENDYKSHINDSLYDVINKIYKASSINLAENNDTLRKQVDLLSEQLTSVQSSIGKNISTTEKKEIQKDIKELVSTSNILMRKEKSYTVYIQYNDSSNSDKKQIASIRKTIEVKSYNVPKEEFINRDFENTSVIYFYDNDKEIAENILTEVKRIYSKAILTKSNVAAPQKQIEIWLNTKPKNP